MIYFIIDNKKVQLKKHGLIQKYLSLKKRKKKKMKAMKKNKKTMKKNKKRKQKKDTMNQKHTWFINIKPMLNQKKLPITYQNKRQKSQKIQKKKKMKKKNKKKKKR